MIKGLYRYCSLATAADPVRVRLVGSGTILREVIAAAELLAQDWHVAAEVWRCGGVECDQLQRTGARGP